MWFWRRFHIGVRLFRRRSFIGRTLTALLLFLLIFVLAYLLIKIDQNQVEYVTDGSKKIVRSEKEHPPSIEYEHFRRRIHSNIQEMCKYVESELTKMKKNNPKLEKHVDKVRKMTAEHKLSLIDDMVHLRVIDGHEKWRRVEAKRLCSLMERRIKHIQNPKDCNKAKKLSCYVDSSCDFGCQLHNVVNCFIMAYATERMLVLDSTYWAHNHVDWDNTTFESLSDTCRTPIQFDRNYKYTDTNLENDQLFIVHVLSELYPRPPFLPLAIPEDLAPALEQLHGNPSAWFVGQFVKYLLRFNPEAQKYIDKNMEDINMKEPIVGILIRRSNKLETDVLHQTEEYMKHVDEYYNQLEMLQMIAVRRVYVATDNPEVIHEMRKKYSHYVVLCNSDPLGMASQSGTQYSAQSQLPFLFDIHLLSQLDYIVCTFSSQICRIVYELMQTRFPDASQRFKSLDDIYFFDGQNPHNRIAVLSHHPKKPNEISMEVGDTIGITGNNWDGFSMGLNRNNNQSGLFPSFKVDDEIVTAKFPKYSNVK